MHVLVVDNKTDEIEPLLAMLRRRGHSCEVAKPSSLANLLMG